nr:uncharacterized protein LOC127299210 [Lolium perenne]
MVALDPNPTPCGGEAPKEEAPLLDLEIGTPEDATAPDCKGETKKGSGLAAAFTKFFEQTDAEKEEADRAARWALRVFLVALWLYLANLMRQFVIASGTGEGRAFTAAVMILVAFSLGGMFCELCTAEGEHTDAGVPVPKPDPRPSSSREPGWTLSPSLVLCDDDDSDYDSDYDSDSD